MKLLTVVVDLDKGGTQRAAQGFAEGYYELGHDSRIITINGLGPRYDEIKNFIKVWNSITENNLNQIKVWQPDVIHIHSNQLKNENVLQILKIKNEDTKVVETNVFSYPSEWANEVDVSFQLSNWAQWLFNLRGGKKHVSTIVPNPIKINAFKKASSQKISEFRQKYNIPKNAFVIGRIGQSYPGKWSPMIVDVFNELQEKIEELYLLLINPPETIIEAVNKSAFKQNVVIIDRIIGDENLSIAYSAMNTMALIAEQGESFGLVITESLLCDTPVVTLNTPWADNSQQEVVGHLKGGLAANSKQGFKEAICLINTKGKELNFQGRKHVMDNYDHLEVSKLALQNIDKNQIKKIKATNIVNMQNKSIDNQTILTKLLLGLNSERFLRYTIVTSGYKSFGDLLIAIKKRLV